MQKTLVILSIFIVLGTSLINPVYANVLKSCYSGDEAKKKIADEAMKQFNQDLSNLKSASDFKDKVSYMKSSKQNYTVCSDASYKWLLYSKIYYVKNKIACTRLVNEKKLQKTQANAEKRLA